MALNKAPTVEGLSKFDIDLKFGQHFEGVIDDIFSGVTKAEVKTERDQWVNYGNFVIETGKVLQSGPADSGLSKTEACVWIHNFSMKGELIASLIIPVDTLKWVIEAMEQDGVGKRTKGGDGWRAQLFLIPQDKIFKYIRRYAKEVVC